MTSKRTAKSLSINSTNPVISFFEQVKDVKGIPLLSDVGSRVVAEYHNGLKNQKKEALKLGFMVFLWALTLFGLGWAIYGAIYNQMGSSMLGVLISGIAFSALVTHEDSNSQDNETFNFTVHFNPTEFRFFQFCNECIKLTNHLAYVPTFAQMLKEDKYLNLWQDMFHANYDNQQLEHVFRLGFYSKFHEYHNSMIAAATLEKEKIEQIKKLEFELSCLKPYLIHEHENECLSPLLTMVRQENVSSEDIKKIHQNISQILKERMENPNAPVTEALMQTVKYLDKR